MKEELKGLIKNIERDITYMMKFFYGVGLTYYIAISQGREKMMLFGTDVSNLLNQPIFEGILLVLLSGSYFYLMYCHSIRTHISILLGKSEVISFGCNKKSTALSLNLIAIVPMIIPPVIILYFFCNYVNRILMKLLSLHEIIVILILLFFIIAFMICGIRVTASIKKAQFKGVDCLREINSDY